MSVEIASKPRAFRVIYGKPEIVEEEVNRLSDEYTVLQYHFFVIKDELVMCAPMIATSEIRKAQLAQARMLPGRQ
jgi:hypothetical protein